MEASVVAEDRSVEIKNKMKFTGKVVKVSLAGAMIDIGAGLPAVMHISQLVSATNQAIKRVEDVLQVGQEVEVWVKRVRPDHIELTMIQPLGLEWRDIKAGMTVKGTVVRLEKFGAFIEIGAERPGLVHISEMAHGYVRAPGDVVKEGDEVEAQVLDVNRRKRQIKLSLKALQEEPVVVEEQPKPVRMPEQAPRPSKESRERPAKRKKSRRQEFEDSSLVMETLETTTPAEAEPTAMELAMRAAMEKAKERKQEARAKKVKAVSTEQEDIFNRTLENKVQS